MARMTEGEFWDAVVFCKTTAAEPAIAAKAIADFADALTARRYRATEPEPEPELQEIRIPGTIKTDSGSIQACGLLDGRKVVAVSRSNVHYAVDMDTGEIVDVLGDRAKNGATRNEWHWAAGEGYWELDGANLLRDGKPFSGLGPGQWRQDIGTASGEDIQHVFSLGYRGEIEIHNAVTHFDDAGIRGTWHTPSELPHKTLGPFPFVKFHQLFRVDGPGADDVHGYVFQPAGSKVNDNESYWLCNEVMGVLVCLEDQLRNDEEIARRKQVASHAAVAGDLMAWADTRTDAVHIAKLPNLRNKLAIISPQELSQAYGTKRWVGYQHSHLINQTHPQLLMTVICSQENTWGVLLYDHRENAGTLRALVTGLPWPDEFVAPSLSRIYADGTQYFAIQEGPDVVVRQIGSSEL